MARPTRPEIANADLGHLYLVRKLSCVQIARMLGCNQGTVLYHLKRLGIERRPRSEAISLNHHKNKSGQGKYIRTPEHRAKMAEARRGANSYLWRGGQTDAEKLRMSGHEWRSRRAECYARDNWTCQDCGVKCRNEVRIQAHHIVSRRLGGDDELDNLVTLCASCHQARERRYADALIA